MTSAWFTSPADARRYADRIGGDADRAAETAPALAAHYRAQAACRRIDGPAIDGGDPDAVAAALDRLARLAARPDTPMVRRLTAETAAEGRGWLARAGAVTVAAALAAGGCSLGDGAAPAANRYGRTAAESCQHLVERVGNGLGGQALWWGDGDEPGGLVRGSARPWPGPLPRPLGHAAGSPVCAAEMWTIGPPGWTYADPPIRAPMICYDHPALGERCEHP